MPKFVFPSGSKLDTKMCRYCDFWDKHRSTCIMLEKMDRCKFGKPELSL